MRILVISDIHSNLVALETVLEDVGSFDALVCCGDVVGFGGSPNECVETLRKLDPKCVMGNHDLSVITGDSSRYSIVLGAANLINRRVLTERNLDWVGNLKKTVTFEIHGDEVTLVHASPLNPFFGYIYKSDSLMRADELLGPLNSKILLMGHTHVPYILEVDERFIINPGSVGLPRDESRSSYMVIDWTENQVTVTHRRVEYDAMEAASKMRDVGIPERLVKRILDGPSSR